MFSSPVNRRTLAAVLMLFACQAATASNSLDPLLRPSTESPRASTALLTGVARAGQRLVAVGERGTILLSDDNGASWRQRPAPVSVMLTNVRFANARKGWAVGHSGVVLATADGGENWTLQLDGVRGAALIAREAKIQAASGADAAMRALAVAERLVADGADKPLLDLLVLDERTVLAVGAYGLAFRSDDGGANWTPWHSRIPNPKDAHLYAITQSGDTVYLAGELGSVFKSTDRGLSFLALTVPYQGSFFGVASSGPGQVVVLGLRGHAFASADGGRTWVRSKIDISASLTGGTALQDGSIVVVSQAGNLVRSIDGGKTFVAIESRQAMPFVGVVQAADGGLVMVGARGVARTRINSSVKQP